MFTNSYFQSPKPQLFAYKYFQSPRPECGFEFLNIIPQW